MNAKFSRIALAEAQPGMVLASDVLTGERVLLPAGTAIDAAKIEGLTRRGVAEIDVLAKVSRSAAELEELRQAQTRRVERLFRRAGSEATTLALRRAVLDYRLRECA